jgi:hypothetical protein
MQQANVGIAAILDQKPKWQKLLHFLVQHVHSLFQWQALCDLHLEFAPTKSHRPMAM